MDFIDAAFRSGPAANSTGPSGSPGALRSFPGAGQSRGERELGALNRRPTAVGRLRDVGERTMSDEFDSLDAREKAALEGALNRCRVLADQIESILRNERREFVDKVSLAEFNVAL